MDFRDVIGRVKPMHGIGNAPLMGTDERLFAYLGEAGIPFSRLHDTGGPYGGYRFVDIPNVFRDFTADPEDPGAYDFAFTDWLLAALHRQGVEPFYRLGVTIENGQRIRAYRIFPPADPLKWAKVCAGIIRHYTQGWADGFHYPIRYWEIWNEPDNEPDVADNPMWKGTAEEFFRLYEVASRYLKQAFPQLKIGGYASCGFYALSDSDFSREAHSSSRVEYFIDFFHRFLSHISSPQQESPLDFFSWHSYAGIEENVRYAAYAREQLDAYGFRKTESFLNEWNPGPQNRGTAKDAASVAAMMCAMQGTCVDGCLYYDGQLTSTYGGIFDPVGLKPFKAFDAFRGFGVLYRLGNEVRCTVSGAGLYGCAAGREDAGALLLANTADLPRQVRLSLAHLPAGPGRVTITDRGRDREESILSADGGTILLPMESESVLLLQAGN